MESLGQLASGIAHDFNNVLTAILGFSDLLLEQLSPQDPRAQDAAEIRKAAESGQRLTRQLRAFSRQQPIEPTRLNLNKIVNESRGILQRLLGTRVQLETVLASSVGDVWADAGQLQQILVNLGVNARDAMPDGGRLTIETSEKIWGAEYRATHPDVMAGSYVVLAVTDTGTGMSAETKARIFEPFFTTKGPDKGTGLGLATVYGIVRQSGGFIDVASTVGHGTTFRIHLPRWKDS
jgi:signal transduction histidine kinase